MRLMIIIAYIFKLYNIRYKIATLNEDALVIYKGKGKWYNTVKLIQINGQLKIIKRTSDKSAYVREKKFYQKYKNNSSNIKLPNMKFCGNNLIEIEFLKMKSFQKKINDGSINLEIALSHHNKIIKHMQLFYKNKTTLIHSDFSTENIFIHNNIYYLIDFADSRIDNIQYDMYVLLRSIIFTYNHSKINKKVDKYSLKEENLSTLLNISLKDTIRCEDKFNTLDKRKHPNRVNFVKNNLFRKAKSLFS